MNVKMSKQANPDEQAGRGSTSETAPLSVLAISFAYPPAASPRAVQVGRLLKHLPVSTTLICADYNDKDRIDPTLVSEVETPLIRCLRIPFVRTGFETLLARAAYRFDLPVLNKWPDQFGPWRPAVLAAVEQLAHSESYTPDLLVTFGSPMSDHLIGLELKRRFNVPWVAHFSDPWADNPFLGYDQLTRSLNRTLERRVLLAADRLVFTSEETVKLFASKHPPGVSAKARVVPHAFEPESFRGSAARDDSAIVVRYLGDFYGRRTPAPLFAALRELLAVEPATLEGVRFELVGSQGDGQLEHAGLGSLPEGLIVVRQPVKYLESLRLMTSANGLLVVDAPAEVSVFLPSKLIDYVGAGRPVLGITPPGTASSLIRRLGGWVADPSDTKAIAGALKSFIAFLRANANEASVWGDADTRHNFEAQGVCEKFAEILHEVGDKVSG
jgi:glycosyltransferase involved in cell wall biosynthesis